MRSRGRSRRQWVFIGSPLLLVDVVLVSLHVRHRVQVIRQDGVDASMSVRPPPAWLSAGDGSLIEFFGQAQLCTAAGLLLFTAAWSPRAGVLAVWGYSFVFMVADDLFMLHEQIGQRLYQGPLLSLLPEPSAREIGGLLFWTLMALPCAASMAIFYRIGSFTARRAARGLLILSMPLAAVATGHVLLNATTPMFLDTVYGQLLTIVRTGVKLLTMSALLIQALSLTFNAWRSTKDE